MAQPVSRLKSVPGCLSPFATSQTPVQIRFLLPHLNGYTRLRRIVPGREEMAVAH
jgi:hypothetical protein